MICNAKTDHFHHSKPYVCKKKRSTMKNILEIKRSESHVPGHVAIVFYPKKCVSISHLYLAGLEWNRPFFFLLTLHTTLANLHLSKPILLSVLVT